MMWQPIETAPKDGTEIVAWIEWLDGASARTGSFLTDGNFWPHDRSSASKMPTYWMPLPLPPNSPENNTN